MATKVRLAFLEKKLLTKGNAKVSDAEIIDWYRKKPSKARLKFCCLSKIWKTIKKIIAKKPTILNTENWLKFLLKKINKGAKKTDQTNDKVISK